ncbi:MAG: hypothetical protein FK731_03380 [Asgard group archaeon]|nr:hypothetical protein [Asgard group archaeon]
MNETSNQISTKSIMNKEYRWSNYSFLIDIISFTLLNILVILLMFMHRNVDTEVNFKDWVAIPVALGLQLLAILFAFLDSRKRNPKEKMFGSRIFNMPIFVITIIITIAIFWGREETLAIVYGGICGGFAGYLAGGLAYANFFIKIKNEVYRTIFGGWIGVVIGAIFGSFFAYLVDPKFGEVFGGIFMGFWGGAIVSGPIATILLHAFRNNDKVTKFFNKIHYYGTIQKVSNDINQYFAIEKNKTLDLSKCKIFEEREDKKITPDAPRWANRILVFFAAFILATITVEILFVLSYIGRVNFVLFDNFPKLELAGLILAIIILVYTIIGVVLFAAYSPDSWWKNANITKWKKIMKLFTYALFLYNPWEIETNEMQIEAFTEVFEFAVEKQGYKLEEKIITK